MAGNNFVYGPKCPINYNDDEKEEMESPIGRRRRRRRRRKRRRCWAVKGYVSWGSCVCRHTFPLAPPFPQTKEVLEEVSEVG